MKIIFVAMMMLFSTAVLAGDQYLVEVNGMSCPFCAYGVEKKVKKMAGVEFVSVNLEAATVTIEMKDGATLPEDALKKAISDAGFSFKSLKKVTHSPEDHKHAEGMDNDHH